LEYSQITIAETLTFQRKVGRFLSSAEKWELIEYLSVQPKAGVLIKGTGGIRKLRWARSGQGKRGGLRVIYYFHSEMMPLYLLSLFGKSEKENISDDEKALMARLVRELTQFWKQRK
jgi:hypothetical protein